MLQKTIGQAYVRQLMTHHVLFDSSHSCMPCMQCGCLHYQQCFHPVSVDHRPTRYSYIAIASYIATYSILGILAGCSCYIVQQSIEHVD